jgi:hypothetical protein
MMGNQRGVPTPDEADSWAHSRRKRKGPIKRFFTRKTVDVAEGVGEAASKAQPATPSVVVPETQSIELTEVNELMETADSRPRAISFAPGVLEHETVDFSEQRPAPEAVAASASPSPIPSTLPPPPPPTELTIVVPPIQSSSRDVTEQHRSIIEASGLALTESGRQHRETGPTPSDEDFNGTARAYWVKGADGVDLELGDIRWDNGERSLAVLDRKTSPQRFDGLVRRLRMTVQAVSGEKSIVELSGALLRQEHHPSLLKVDVPAFSQEIGIDIAAELLAAGADEVGTKAALLGVTHQKRGYWCALFPDANQHLPAIAFFLMRIVPVHLELKAP